MSTNKPKTKTKSITLSCSCSCTASTHTFSIPLCSLPLPTNLCSCDISRRISGSLLTSYVNITHGHDTVKPDTSTLTGYDSSSILRRWFCATCGTHLFLEYWADGRFEAATGTLSVEEGEGMDGVIEYKSCMWIEDTKDGGASQYIRDIEGRELERWSREAGDSEEVDIDWRNTPSPTTEDESAKPIHAHCHCRGVQFWVSSPNNVSKAAKSPWPDLLIPHSLNSSSNPANIPWWLPSVNRYLAGTCTCTSCRRASGFDITFWAFIPTANIFLDADLTTPFLSSGHWSSMKTYSSSEGVTRTFCSRCGANVFWNGDKERFGREGLVDVAVGLLDAESGARAEEVLGWWTGRVSFREDALNEGLVGGLERGLKMWEERNRGMAWVAGFDEGVLKGGGQGE